jgi:hypothetical protein
MTWTYAGNPASTPTAQVRFLVGDTVSTDPLCTDEEIAWALTQNTDARFAASMIADSIAMKFATMKQSVKIGPIAEDYGRRAEYYALRAKELKVTAVGTSTLNIYDPPVNVDGTEKIANFSIGMTDSTGLDNE